MISNNKIDISVKMWTRGSAAVFITVFFYLMVNCRSQSVRPEYDVAGLTDKIGNVNVKLRIVRFTILSNTGPNLVIEDAPSLNYLANAISQAKRGLEVGPRIAVFSCEIELADGALLRWKDYFGPSGFVIDVPNYIGATDPDYTVFSVLMLNSMPKNLHLFFDNLKITYKDNIETSN